VRILASDTLWYSKNAIEVTAQETYKNACGAGISPSFPLDVEAIVEVYLGYSLVWGSFIRDGALGSVDWTTSKIRVSDEAMSNSGRSKFTVAHEIGHVILHVPILIAREKQIPLFESARVVLDDTIEWQADYFASALLMPKDVVSQTFGPLALSAQAIQIGDVAEFFGVSNQAARLRLQELGLVHSGSPGTSLNL
jgi:IrrE N-terminal-like domain